MKTYAYILYCRDQAIFYTDQSHGDDIIQQAISCESGQLGNQGEDTLIKAQINCRPECWWQCMISSTEMGPLHSHQFLQWMNGSLCSWYLSSIRSGQAAERTVLLEIDAQGSEGPLVLTKLQAEGIRDMRKNES